MRTAAEALGSAGNCFTSQHELTVVSFGSTKDFYRKLLRLQKLELCQNELVLTSQTDVHFSPRPAVATGTGLTRPERTVEGTKAVSLQTFKTHFPLASGS
jgi:hypothetical protein